MLSGGGELLSSSAVGLFVYCFISSSWGLVCLVLFLLVVQNHGTGLSKGADSMLLYCLSDILPQDL